MGSCSEHAIKQPVSIPVGKAAMVPIVTGAVKGEKLTIYDPEADTAHALNGFLLKNSTGLQLPGGPITVFADGSRVGDAQIGTMRPGEDRFPLLRRRSDLAVAHEAPKLNQQTLTSPRRAACLWSPAGSSGRTSTPSATMGSWRRRR